MSEATDEIEIVLWWKPGNGMMYNTSALDPDHKMHPYNQILAMGKVPEDYGYEDPYAAMMLEEKGYPYLSMTKRQLVIEIFKLHKEIEALERIYA